MRRLVSLLALVALLVPEPVDAAPKEKKEKPKEEEEEFPADEPRPSAKDFEEEEEEEATPPPARLDEGDKDEPEKDPDDLEFKDEDEDVEIDFKDDDLQEDVKPRGPGEDTALLYRDAQQKNAKMTPEEELLAWERYLQKYPKSLFKDRIDSRMEDLSALLFGERVPGSDKGARMADAALRELNFAIPLHWSPIDTRSRITGGVEVGIPNWASGHIDFEWAFLRELSAHVGVKREYTNFAFTPGAKYAFIKSARTGTVLTGGLDLRIYAGPAFVGVRPNVGFGQRFKVMDGLDVQATLAVDPEFRDPFGMRYFAGLGAQLHPNETVSVFLESSMNMKHLGSEEVEPFRFMITTFGLKFTAAKPKNQDGDRQVDLGIGANIPYSVNYWGFYRGAVTIDGSYNL